MRKKPSNSKGFTLIELMIVIAIIAMLASVAIPSFIKAREKTQATICVKIQREMEGAKAQAAIENRWDSGTSFGTLGGAYQTTLASYIKSGGALAKSLPSGATRPICPLGFSIYWNGIDETVTCQSFLPSHTPF